MKVKSGAKAVLRNIYKSGTLHFLYPLRYQRYAKRPVISGKTVFLEIRMNGLTDNFQELYQQMKKNEAYHVTVRCIREGMAGRFQVCKNEWDALRDLADAEYIFINDSSYFISCLPLRPETKVIQTWHACGAFKKFGYSVADKKFGSGKSDLERFPVHKNFSMVTVSSREVVWAYAEAFHMESEKEKIVSTGISRTDCYYSSARRKAAQKRVSEVIGQHLGIEAKNKKIVLYAPTFRGKVAYAKSPERLDFEKLCALAGDDYIFLCKHHPFVKKRPEIPAACSDRVLDVTELLEIEDLLMCSDVCITDYSSLIFEYSLMERPMLFFAYDLDEYYDERGFYYPYRDLVPGPILSNTEEVAACLKNMDNWFDRNRVIRFKEKYMGACDGHATERILQLLER